MTQLARRLGEVERTLAGLSGPSVSASGREQIAFTPHAGQRAFLDSPQRRRVVCAHRRWGKDFVTLFDALTRAREWAKEPHRDNLEPKVAVQIVYPDFGLARAAWQLLRRLIPAWEIAGQWESVPQRLTLRSGVEFELRSADTPSKLVARGTDYLLIGEAARVAEEALQVALPGLASPGRAGYCTIQSTPFGGGWLEQLYERGQDSEETDWASWQIPFFLPGTHERHALASPLVDMEEVVRQERELSADRFSQEWLCQFLAGVGVVFSDVGQRIADAPANPKRPIVCGVDWGKRQDHSVFSAFDSLGRQVAVRRMGRQAYPAQIAALCSFVAEHKVETLIVEETGVGDPLKDALEQALFENGQRKVKVEGFTTSQASKRAAINRLQVAFEGKQIALLPDPTQQREFETFQRSETAGGTEMFAAPSGGHDDFVLSASFAFSQIAAGIARRPLLLSSSVHNLGNLPYTGAVGEPSGFGVVKVRGGRFDILSND